MKSISMYIHIPFCRSKCFYCDFASFAKCEQEYIPYIKSLIQEMQEHQDLLQEHEIRTVFIGGGTPTVLPPSCITLLMDALHSHFSIRKDAEITIESNPGTLSKDMLITLRENGLNRLSIGLQTLHDPLLKTIGRIHSAEDLLENFHMARCLGFDNINLDLMFSLPGQKMEAWKDTIQKVIELSPEHISCYSLIVEEGTPFADWYQEGRFSMPDEELDRSMYHWARKTLQRTGYHQYEISNFAKEKKECRHNLVYWRAEEYIGLGLGAHSYFQGTRYHNTYDLKTYIRARGNLGEIREDFEPYERRKAYEEYMFLGLRLLEGVSEGAFLQRFGCSLQEIYGVQIQKLIQSKLIKQEGERVRLTKRGLDLSNLVFEEFLLQ